MADVAEKKKWVIYLVLCVHVCALTYVECVCVEYV